jgi:hypothetical protein
MRTLIYKLENNLTSQEDTVKKMEEQAKSIQHDYQEQQKIIESVRSSGIFGEDGNFDPNDEKSVAAMREFVSKRSSLLGFDGGMGDDMDDPNNPYSSKGGLSGRSGFPRMSNATGSKESIVGGKSGRSGPGGAISLEDEANLTPQQLRDRQRRELEMR